VISAYDRPGTIPPKVEPGDWFVVNSGSRFSSDIRIAEYISDKVERYPDPRLSEWNHAAMVVAVGDPPPNLPRQPFSASTIWIAEAEGGGAKLAQFHYRDRPFLFSTGIVEAPPDAKIKAASAALRYTQPGPWGKTGVPYGYLDYGALTLHSLQTAHLAPPVPGLQHFIQTSNHMICSQLVDRSCNDGGWHLFADGRWDGYVKPSDLGFLLVTA
jgi:hypothetical protein